MAALALGLLAGCSTMVPFSHEMRTQHQLTDDDVRRLQFYVSHTVKLRRELESTGRRIDGGELKLSSGKLIEEVVVREKTPGVAVAVSAEAITVSFEEGSSLTFGLHNGRVPNLPLRLEPSGGFAEPPDPFPGDGSGERKSAVPELLGNYFLETDVDGAYVRFGGKVWEAFERSSSAHLLIDAEELQEVMEDKTVLKGRRISRRERLPLLRL